MTIDQQRSWFGVAVLAAAVLFRCGPAEFGEQGLDDELGTQTGELAAPRGFVWSRTIVSATSTRAVGSAMWVGNAANAYRPGVVAEIKKRIANGESPYLFFYHWGDGGAGRPLSDFANASAGDLAAWVQWGSDLASAIGSTLEHPAYVVLEPEYDSHLNLACSPAFSTNLKTIIANFRRLAPNAKLINGPGLWKPESAYACFKPLAALMNYQGFLVHVTSNDPACTLRSDGTRFGGGEQLGTAVQMKSKIEARIAKLRAIFGGAEFFVSDAAITSCGWGEDGQRQIFKALVDALPALDGQGLRGLSLRNGGPSVNDRYMGVNNEGMFGYTTRPAHLEYDRAPAVLQAYLKTLGTAGPTVPVAPPAWTPTFRPSPNVSEWWVEATVADAVKLEVSVAGGSFTNLPPTGWGSFAENLHVVRGATVVLRATRSDGASARSASMGWLGFAWAPAFRLGNVNEWWAEVYVERARTVELSVAGAPFQPLARNPWGGFAEQAHIVAGTRVEVRAWRGDGAVASRVYLWLQ